MLSSRLPLVAGVVAALLAPAAVVLAAPGNPPPAPPSSGRQAGAAAASAAPAPRAPASAPRVPGTSPSASAPGAPPAPPPGYPYPYPPRSARPGYPPAYGYGYPPPGYGYPPPYGYGYPPPGYGYPPPYGYGYPPPGYGYPPPGYEAAPNKPAPLPRRPPHDAASRSPFFDAQAALLVESNRFGSPFTVGLEAGVFIADRLRLAGRFMTSLSTPSDTYSGSGSLGQGYSPEGSKPISLIWGASAGYAVISDPGFVLSPGLLFLRTDISDYGSFLGADVPFEWVSRSGFRIGFEVALGQSFGGTVIEQCQDFTYSSATTPCSHGTRNEISRDGGVGFYGSFVVGWGI